MKCYYKAIGVQFNQQKPSNVCGISSLAGIRRLVFHQNWTSNYFLWPYMLGLSFSMINCFHRVQVQSDPCCIFAPFIFYLLDQVRDTWEIMFRTYKFLSTRKFLISKMVTNEAELNSITFSKLSILRLLKEAQRPVLRVFQIVIPYNQRLKLFMNINFDSMQDMFDKKHSLYVPYSPQAHENDFKYLILSPFHQNMAILDSQRYFREEVRVKLSTIKQGEISSRSLNDSLNEFDHIQTFSNRFPMRDQEVLLLHSNTNGPQILEFKVLKGGMGEMHLTSIDEEFDQRWVNLEYQDKISPKMPKEKHSCMWSVTKDGKQLQILYICYDKEAKWKSLQGKRSLIKEILINI